MYESPINLVFEAQQNAMRFAIQQQEDGIMAAVHSYGITVDKEELTRALRYDRGQYDKGYADGKRDAEPKHGRWEKHRDDVCYWYECSECHEPPAAKDCPNCGAKMEWEV